MKANKRKKLEAAGWRVGSAEEFLGLSKGQLAEVDRICRRIAAEKLGRQWAEEAIAKIRKALDKLPPIRPRKKAARGRKKALHHGK